MFGVSFLEVAMIGLVALIVVGPQKLPGMMRTAGEWVGRLRRLTSDMRAQTGIDDILREEGIDGVRELRTLLRGERVLGAKNNPRPYGYEAYSEAPDPGVEFPTEGPDALGALPDDLLAGSETQATAQASNAEEVPTEAPAGPPPLVQEMAPSAALPVPRADKPLAPSSRPPAPSSKSAEVTPSNGSSLTQKGLEEVLQGSLPPPPVPARRLHSRAVTIPETPRSKSEPSSNVPPAVSEPKPPSPSEG